MKEVLLYDHIHNWTAQSFIHSINEIDGDKLVVRIDTEGGDPQSTYGMIAKYNEYEGEKVIKVDGRAYSMGFFFVAMAENVEALEVSEFAVHRAAYPSWVEESPRFEGNPKAILERINKTLRKAFEAKVDVKMFEEMKGVKVKDIFSMDQRIDVFLTAKEAKKIGLIKKINKMTPKIKALIEANQFNIAACISGKSSTEETEEIIETVNNKDMNLEKIKAEHPALYAQILALGVVEGTNSERDRVGAWLVGNDVDPKAVVEGIKGGKNISQTAMAEFSMKAAVDAQKLAVTGENAEAVVTVPVVETPVLTGIAKETADIQASLKAELEKTKK